MVHHRTQRQHDVCLYSTVCLLNISGQQMIDDEPSGNFYRLVESHLHVESRIIQTGINNDCMYDVSIMYNKVQIKGGHRCLSVTLHFFYPSKKKKCLKKENVCALCPKMRKCLRPVHPNDMTVSCLGRPSQSATRTEE